MAFDFFAAAQIYQALVAPLDPSLLPLHRKSYLLEPSTGQYRQHFGMVLRQLPDSWIENARYQLDVPTGRFDTTRTYWKLDASNRVMRYSDAMTEGPLFSGTAFRYESDHLAESILYSGGKPLFTTTCQYLDGKLARTVTLDTASDTVSTNAYTYVNGELTGIERFPQTGYYRTTITYFTPDSIAIDESNAANFPPGSRQILVLRNGNTIAQYNYDGSQIIEYAEWTYPGSAAARNRRKSTTIRNAPPLSFDLLGRTLPQATPHPAQSAVPALRP